MLSDTQSYLEDEEDDCITNPHEKRRAGRWLSVAASRSRHPARSLHRTTFKISKGDVLQTESSTVVLALSHAVDCL